MAQPTLALTHDGMTDMLLVFFTALQPRSTYFTVKLFTNVVVNDATPSSAYSFVNESYYGGAKKITPSQFCVSNYGDTSTIWIPYVKVGTISPMPIDFTFTIITPFTPANGFCIVNESGNVIAWQDFANPYTPTNVGDTLSLTIDSFKLGNLAKGAASW